MQGLDFGEKLQNKVYDHGKLVVGIDPNIDNFSSFLRPATASPQDIQKSLEDFSNLVLKKSAPFACGAKFQMAYFEKWGPPGLQALTQAIKTSRELGLLVILDGKRGDIGSTSQAYAEAYLAPHHRLPGGLDIPNVWEADALTVNPFLGMDTLEPFHLVAASHNKGIFVLLRTSNPGSGLIQNAQTDGVHSWEVLADYCCQQKQNNKPFSPLGAVVGATIGNAKNIRNRLPHSWLLAPGFGFQGGKLSTLRSLLNQDKSGLIVPVSRALTAPIAGRASDFGNLVSDRARKLQKVLAEL